MAVGKWRPPQRPHQRLLHHRILLLRLPRHLLRPRPHQWRHPCLHRRAHPAWREGMKRKMSSSMAELQVLTAAVITVSDSCARGEREDLSGPAVAQLLQNLHFTVSVREVVSDNSVKIQNVLVRLAREVQFVVTTGGTGIAVRDVTPEATMAVCERLLDGDRKSTRLNSSHQIISYAVFCLKKK